MYYLELEAQQYLVYGVLRKADHLPSKVSAAIRDGNIGEVRCRSTAQGTVWHDCLLALPALDLSLSSIAPWLNHTQCVGSRWQVYPSEALLCSNQDLLHLQLS
jgi:hypothetical protein